MKISTEIVNTVGMCELFQEMQSNEIAEVLRHASPRTVPNGQLIFNQGEPSETLYIVVKGSIKLSSLSAEGHQVIVTILQEGNGLGITVALAGLPYPVSAEALEDCKLFAWSTSEMKRLMYQYPQLAINGIRLISKQFIQLQERFREVSTLRVEQRVALALLRLKSQFGKVTDEGILIDIALTRDELSQMTGTNQFNISRILSKWENANIIESGRERIVLLDCEQLKNIVEDLARKDISMH